MFPQQLEFIHYLHKARSPLLDHLISLCDFFDRQEFLFILIPMIWLGLGSKWGMRIFYLLALSCVVNEGLKNLFALPRPFHLDPTVGIIQVKDYGFPSGAAQTAMILSGLLLLYWKSKWKWLVAIAYVTILSFSRVYLGVHFPIDILGGWIVGLLLLGSYVVIFPKVEKSLARISPLQVLMVSDFVLMILICLSPSKTMTSLCACAIGVGVGAFACRRIKLYRCIPKTKWGFSVRILIGIVGVFVIHNLVEKFFNLQSLINTCLLFTAIGLWMSFGAFYLYNKLVILGAFKPRA